MGGNRVGRAVLDVDIDASGAAKELNRLRSELNALERAKFAPGTKAAAAASREVDRLNKSIRDLGGTVDKSGNFINRHATALNQLAFSAARAGSGIANFLPFITRVTTLLARHEFGEGGFGGAVRSLTGRMRGASTAADELGTSLSADARLLDALKNGFAETGTAAEGMAGATTKAAGALSGATIAAGAAVAALAAVVIGVGILTVKLGPLGSALTKAQNSIKLIFEGAGQDMLKFAQTASIAFGITEQAALRFVGKTGQLFKSFGIGAESASEMSKALLVTADVLRSTSTEFIDSESALQAVFDTVAGNVEGLRRFDIFLSELGLTQVALRNNLKVTTGAFDNVQRSLVSQIAAIEKAKERYEQYIKTQDSTARTAERTRAAFDSIKASIGQGFAPLLSFVSNVLLGIVVLFREFGESIGSFVEKNEALVGALKKIADAAIKMQPGLLVLAKVLGFLHDKGEEAAQGALSFDENLETLNEGLAEAQRQFNEYRKELTTTDLEQLIDAHRRLKDAVRNAARAEREAQKDLSRALEDSVRDRAEAQRDLAEAIEDAEERLFEARKKVADTEKKNFRDIRDAERRLARERLDSARRVDDAERALHEARVKRMDSILSAQLSLEEALAAGDALAERRARLQLSEARRPEDLAEAQRRLAEEEFDAKERIKLAEEKLHETRLDAYEALKEAERELGLVIEENHEAILEARQKLHEVEIEISRTLADSAQALREAQREGRKAIKEAERQLDRLNWQFGTMDMTLAQILDKLERMKNAMLTMPPLSDGLLSPGSKANPGVGELAIGGSALGGHPYLVGERGPELFIPNRNGEVISNKELLRALSQLGSRGGGGNFTIVEAVNAEATARAVESRIAQRLNN